MCHLLDLELDGELTDESGEPMPRHVGLGAVQHEQIAAGLVAARREQDALPVQDGVEALTQLHDGATGPVVDVDVVVELDDRVGGGVTGDGVDGRLRGPAGVDPAGQHHEQDGLPQLRPFGQPACALVPHQAESTADRVQPMAIDVTDATFQTDVIERSLTTPVVVDLWATWCGPCETLGPILDKVVGETNGQVELVKVDIDANPGVAQAFRVQSIPMVVAFQDGQPVDAFMGAQGEHEVREFVQRLLPSAAETQLAALIAAGDETSLRIALESDPGNEDAIVALAEMLVARGDVDEALALLGRIPETDRTRLVAAKARVHIAPDDDYDDRLGELLDRVKDDDEARQEFIDILELMGPDDPRTARLAQAADRTTLLTRTTTCPRSRDGRRR